MMNKIACTLPLELRWLSLIRQWVSGYAQAVKFTPTLEELLHTLAEFRDYSDLHRCASRALQMNSDNLCALYWLIFATYLQGALCNAKTLLKEARMNLTKSEYEELEQRLKKTDGISLDFTGCEPLENK